MIADDLEPRADVTKLDGRLGGAHPRKQRVGEFGHVPLGRLALHRQDRLSDTRRLPQVGHGLLVDVCQVTGTEAGIKPEIEDFGRLLVFVDVADLCGVEPGRVLEAREGIAVSLRKTGVGFDLLAIVVFIVFDRRAGEMQCPVIRMLLQGTGDHRPGNLIATKHFGLNVSSFSLGLVLFLNRRHTPQPNQVRSHLLHEFGERSGVEIVERAEDFFDRVESIHFRGTVASRKRLGQQFFVQLNRQRPQADDQPGQLLQIALLLRPRERDAGGPLFESVDVHVTILAPAGRVRVVVGGPHAQEFVD